MLDKPMSQVALELPISDECRIALLRGENALAALLRQCERCERGDFQNLLNNQTRYDAVFYAFQAATLWADTVLETLRTAVAYPLERLLRLLLPRQGCRVLVHPFAELRRQTASQ
jgi:hypothetical protein